VPAEASYAGHGQGSVSEAVLARYPVERLQPELARRIEAMMDLVPPSTGAVSEDGKKLVFNWRVTGTPQVWTMDGPMRFPRQLTGGEDATSLVAILQSGEKVVVSRDRKGEEYPGLYLQDVGGGPLTVIQHLPKVRTSLAAITDDSKQLYFTANDIAEDAYAIYRYTIATQKKELVFNAPGLWFVADVSDDETKLLLHKATGGMSAEYYELEIATKTLTPLFGQGETEEYQASYGRGGDIVVLTNKLGEFRRLYLFKKGTLSPLTPELPHDIHGFSVDRRRQRILYGTNEAGFQRLYALDAKTHKPVRLPALPKADQLVFGATSRNGRYTTVGVSDSTFAQRTYVLDWKTGKLSQWHQPSVPELDTSVFARAVLEHYETRDGTSIPVLVRSSKRCETELCPVVVSFHGGPEGQAMPGFNLRAQAFVDAGFIYAEPNVRGSDGFGKSWVRADDGPKRLAVLTDIEDAAKWARKRFEKGGKAPALGAHGGSYGGYSVLMAMTKFAGAFDAGVNVVGISNLLTFLENTAPYRRILRASEYGDPKKDREALIQLSPTTYLDQLAAPLLSLQGVSDPRVPAGEAIQIHEALEKKGVAQKLMLFPDEGHGAVKRANQVLMLGHAIAFFKAQLGGNG
jgi:dipeptidyl aminopeptidase/acylaminoacyl peptidase